MCIMSSNLDLMNCWYDPPQPPKKTDALRLGFLVQIYCVRMNFAPIGVGKAPDLVSIIAAWPLIFH